MSDVKAQSPSLADLAAKLDAEFLAIKNSEIAGNRSVVQKAIAFGDMLNEAKAQVGHSRWVNWVSDNCREISKSTAERYMKLAKSPEVRAELGKNITETFLTLRKALAIANPSKKNKKNESDLYDTAESNLIAKLEELAASPLAATVEEAADNTIKRLREAVVRLKSPEAGAKSKAA
jgi:hypothetical protein